MRIVRQIILMFFLGGQLMLILSSCAKKEKDITSISDYEKYLSQSQEGRLDKIDAEIDFWTKRLASRNNEDYVSMAKLAGNYSRRFNVGGDIKNLHLSDSFFRAVKPILSLHSSGIYRSMAANAISQHQFKLAKSYIDTALSMGDDLALSYLVQSDVALELGDNVLATSALERYPEKESFEYLVRKAKLTDHQGNLDQAIILMETAIAKLDTSLDISLFCWAKSNVGDMYGHANQYQKAYQSYLEVLKTDPHYHYALKGIAWLAFSHDKKTADAKRILNYLKTVHPVPDYDYLLMQVYAYENNPEEKEKSMNRFMNEVQNPLYGDMYNKYVFLLAANELNDTSRAMRIAKIEVENRPTPQSYDLLAWAHYKSGNTKEALEIEQKFVEGKCFEPDVVYHMGEIYMASGNKEKAAGHLKDAETAAIELGPVTHKKIVEALKAL